MSRTPPERTNGKKPLLEVRDLDGWYGESHVLHRVSLDLMEGETITLVGRNGAGKTTTLRAIMNLLPRREGEIRIDGHDMMKVPVHRTAHHGIGYVPEERGIFASLSVTENLMLPPKVADGGMSVEEIFELFPNLAERRNSPGTKLSGGEQQMLAIARILRTGVRIILLDEPTEGLAPVIIQRIGDVLIELKKKGMTLLLVEQNFRFARKVADRFYLMEDGHILESFPTSQLDAKMDRLNEVVGV